MVRILAFRIPRLPEADMEPVLCECLRHLFGQAAVLLHLHLLAGVRVR
jgi:hypothetical protein